MHYLGAGSGCTTIAPTADNNVVGATARLRRAPEYTARKAMVESGRWGNSFTVHGRRAFMPSAAWPTSERYTQARERLCR
jgi:hypothetical protein